MPSKSSRDTRVKPVVRVLSISVCYMSINGLQKEKKNAERKDSVEKMKMKKAGLFH